MEGSQVSECFLLTLYPSQRSLCFPEPPESLQSAWREDEAEHFLAQVELAAITTGVALGRAWMQHRDAIWFVDSSAALASVVRTESKCESVDVATRNTHLILMRDGVRVLCDLRRS